VPKPHLEISADPEADLDAAEDLSLVVSGCGEGQVDHGCLRGRNEDLPRAWARGSGAMRAMV